MIAKVFAVAALVSAAVAQQTCSTGPVQCCNSVQQVHHDSVAQALQGSKFGLVDVLAAIGNLDALVGVTCNPISVIGAGGNSCSAQTVCCNNNNFNGVVALGCTPINVNA